MSRTDLTIREDMVETKRHKLRLWVFRGAGLLVLAGLLIFIIAALGYRFGFLDLGTSLRILSFKIGPLILLLALVLSLIALAMALLIKPRKRLLVTIMMALVPFGGLLKLATVQSDVKSLPFIHDITTDTQNPPQFTPAIISLRGDESNSVEYIGKTDQRENQLISVLQSNTEAYKDIRPVLSSDTPEVVFGQALALVKQQRWTIVTNDVDAGIIEATDTTFWYGFKDDVIIRIRPSEGGGTIVDMRSVSRIGQSDLGKNAKRLRLLIDGLSN